MPRVPPIFGFRAGDRLGGLQPDLAYGHGRIVAAPPFGSAQTYYLNGDPEDTRRVHRADAPVALYRVAGRSGLDS